MSAVDPKRILPCAGLTTVGLSRYDASSELGAGYMRRREFIAIAGGMAVLHPAVGAINEKVVQEAPESAIAGFRRDAVNKQYL